MPEQLKLGKPRLAISLLITSHKNQKKDIHIRTKLNENECENKNETGEATYVRAPRAPLAGSPAFVFVFAFVFLFVELGSYMSVFFDLGFDLGFELGFKPKRGAHIRTTRV